MGQPGRSSVLESPGSRSESRPVVQSQWINEVEPKHSDSDQTGRRPIIRAIPAPLMLCHSLNLQRADKELKAPPARRGSAMVRHGSKAGHSSGWLGSTPPDPILSAFTEAGRVRKPRPEPASIRTSSPGTELAYSSEKFEVLLFSHDDGGGRRGRARSQDHCKKELVQNQAYLY